MREKNERYIAEKYIFKLLGDTTLAVAKGVMVLSERLAL